MNSQNCFRPRIVRLPAVTAALAAAGLVGTAQAQLQVAGELFVDVDATAQPLGALNAITNNGTLGGFFEARGGPTEIPAIGMEGGTKGIRFDGTDFMQLVGTLGGPVTPPPAGLVGLNPTRTIDVWAYNQNIFLEETMVSWGKRGGNPNGSNMSFNYGYSGAFGAVGHWSTPDIGWNNAGGAPAAGRWHHLVYTFDGTTTRVYADGVLANSETLPANSINTHTNTAINLATQLDADGVTRTAGLRGSLTLARVRIHDGVLDGAQVLSNYNLEKGTFIDPLVTASDLAKGPTHRWSFDEPATNDATGLTFNDSIGTAHGVVRGAGAAFSGTRLSLPGGSSTTQAYGDLPNNLLSVNGTNNGGSGEFTAEAWIRVTGARTWGRIFDFGSTVIAPGVFGEVTGPGGGGEGRDYLFYSAQVGGDTATHRLELRNEDPAGGGVTTMDFGTFGTFNNDLHVVVSWREATGEISVYENGAFAGKTVVDDAMSDVNDVNVWLGRSNWAADQNMQAEFDEFRIYDHVLDSGEVLGNFQAGPNTLNDGNQPARVVADPVNLTAYETYDARFSVAALGSPAVRYQWLRDGQAIAEATASSYILHNVTLADSGSVFSCVVSNFAGGAPHLATSATATLTVVTQAVTLAHRYSFNGPAGSTTVEDLSGSAAGSLVGGAALTGDGRAVLDGLTGYVNLPNDLVSTLTSLTIEAWVQDDGSAGWARVFDFGNSAAGEDFAPGTTGAAGTQYMFLAAPSGLGNLRGAFTTTGGGAGEQVVEWPGNSIATGQVQHVVWVLNDPMDTGRLFVNGTLVGENTAVTLNPMLLGPTQNDWLGRSQFNDPFFRGQFDEFRIWRGAMTPAQVAASRAAGPEAMLCGLCLNITLVSPSKVKISYPAYAGDFFLESSSTLGPDAVWQSVFGTQMMEGDFISVEIEFDPASPQFFRLSR